MTVKELASVMGNQFIAVASKQTGNISYSGSASKFKSFLENAAVVEVKMPKRESSATIIYVK